MKTKLLGPVLMSMMLATSLPAQIYVSVNKGSHYTQTGASTVTPNNPTPYSVNADISGSGLSTLIPTGPNQVTPSVGGPYGLTYDSGKQGWNYDGGGMSLSTLDSTYPTGNWTLQSGGNTWILNLSGDLYPNAPIATFSAGTWSGGILNLTAAEAAAGFTVTTNVFSTNYLSGSGYVGLFLENLSAENFPTFTTSSVTLNVAGGALGAGTHNLSMDFQRIIAMDSLVSGYVALVGYNANTNLTIQVEAIPEPSTYAAIFGVLALLGVLMRRRGRTA
jgi:hypothetical protein